MSYIFPAPLEGKIQPKRTTGFARVKEIDIMGHIKSVFAVAAVAVAMLVVSIAPAVASSTDSIVFFPVTLGNGATYSCTGGPPFVFNSDDSSGNCAVQQIGMPADLVCDVPTTITFVHDMHEFTADGSSCH
jgi:hypothetical protein